MRILSTGSYVPPQVFTNTDLATMVDTTDEWIVSRTGIRERHITTDENTSDLAYKAAMRALHNAGLTVQDIDLIVTGTCTPDAFFPGVSGMVQRRMGISCPAFDVNAACSGFVYALTVARGLMTTHPHDYKHVLVIGAEVLSKLINWQDRNTCVLFGDGAGAMILRNDDTLCIAHAYIDAKGDHDYALKSGGVQLNNPLLPHDMAWDDYRIQMQGQEVFKFAVRAVAQSIDKTLRETGLAVSDIDYFVCHQANYRIIEKIARDLGVSQDKFYMNLSRYGNTSAASIPLVLDDMNQTGLLRSGMKLLVAGFGAGLTWGSLLIQWP